MGSVFETGEWLIPNGRRYSGRLVFDDAKITLEIFGQEYIEGEVIRMPNDNPKNFHHIIHRHGYHSGTLYNCYLSGCELIGHNLYKVSYTIDYYLNGICLDKADDMKFKSGTFMYPNLSTWYDGSLSLSKLEGKQGLWVDGEHVIEDVLSQDTIPINDDLTIVLDDDVSKEMIDVSISYKVEYKKYLTFKYSSPVSFKRILKDANTFKKLLEFCFGNPIAYKIVSVGFSKPTLGVVPYIGNYTLHKGKKIEVNGSVSYYMLFSGSSYETKVNLNLIVANWFRNEAYYNIYEHYIDSNNWFQGSESVISNLMFNNRLLNLVQGLEDYYRENFELERTQGDKQQFEENKKQILAGITDPNLKKWLNDSFKFSKYPKLSEKLKTVVSDVLPFISQMFNGISLDDFITSVQKSRNDLSHGKNKEVYQGEEFHSNFLIAQILLAVCILKSLGAENIKDKIENYLPFKDSIFNIRHQKRNVVS